MDIPGIKYPFGPLPPPESPDNRNVSQSINTLQSNQKNDFKSALQDKSIALDKQPEKPDELTELKKVAEDMEAYFMYSILKKFNSANVKSGLFGESPGSKMYMDMFFEQISNEMSKANGGLGLSESIVRSFEEKAVDQSIDELQDSIQQQISDFRINPHEDSLLDF